MRCFWGVLKPRKHLFKFCSQQSLLICTIYIFYIQSFILFAMFELQNGFPALRPFAQPQAVAGSEHGLAEFGRGLPVPMDTPSFPLLPSPCPIISKYYLSPSSLIITLFLYLGYLYSSISI